MANLNLALNVVTIALLVFIVLRLKELECKMDESRQQDESCAVGYGGSVFQNMFKPIASTSSPPERSLSRGSSGGNSQCSEEREEEVEETKTKEVGEESSDDDENQTE